MVPYIILPIKPLESKLAMPWGSLAPIEPALVAQLDDHEAHSLYIEYVAVCSGPLHKSYQSSPWALNRPHPRMSYVYRAV